MKKLYLDMDGVVADFDEYAAAIAGMPKGTTEPDVMWPDEVWNQVISNKRLYRDLPKTREADMLVDKCRNAARMYGLELYFLTAIPHSNDCPFVFNDKVWWINHHFGDDIPVHFGPYSVDKQHHCTKNDVLIDDRRSNISQWNDAGGYGILHRTGDGEATIKALQWHLTKVFGPGYNEL